MFTLKINTANEAFDNAEIARILRAIAQTIEEYPSANLKTERAIRDINGNTVGKWELK